MQLPEFFRDIFWSYNFAALDSARDVQRIVINTINYGASKHWVWIANTYGKPAVAEIIEDSPSSEFRPGALKLACILFGAKTPIHASRFVATRT
jgi:hypothetical protein